MVIKMYYRKLHSKNDIVKLILFKYKFPTSGYGYGYRRCKKIHNSFKLKLGNKCYIYCPIGISAWRNLTSQYPKEQEGRLNK